MRQRPSWNSLSVSVEVINILEDCSNILIRIHTFPAIFPSLTIPSLDETPLRLCSLLLELLLRPEQSLSCILPMIAMLSPPSPGTNYCSVQLFALRAAALQLGADGHSAQCQSHSITTTDKGAEHPAIYWHTAAMVCGVFSDKRRYQHSAMPAEMGLTVRYTDQWLRLGKHILNTNIYHLVSKIYEFRFRFPRFIITEATR